MVYIDLGMPKDYILLSYKEGDCNEDRGKKTNQ